jgi:hypothetical protein
VALLPTPAQTSSLTQAPRTTASSSYSNSTTFIWHSRGVRCPPRCLPACSQDQQAQQSQKSVIPIQHSVTEQLTKNWATFQDLCQHYICTRFEEQLQLHLPQQHKATVTDSTLRVEMNALEEQANNVKARYLYWKPLSWLGTIRPTSTNNAFDPALWETFVSTTLGLGIPVLSSLPSLHNRPITKCGCKKHALDLYCHHTSTCTAH